MAYAKTKKHLKIWTKKKAALYVRVSTRYQVDKDSLPFQRKKLKEYCDKYNLTKGEAIRKGIEKLLEDK